SSTWPTTSCSRPPRSRCGRASGCSNPPCGRKRQRRRSDEHHDRARGAPATAAALPFTPRVAPPRTRRRERPAGPDDLAAAALPASLDACRRLDGVGVTALPARTSWELPGWLCLADDGGYVNRANSATPLPAEDAATVSEVAAGYRERGLPPLIRWTPEAPEATAAQLEAEGWRSRGEVL